MSKAKLLVVAGMLPALGACVPMMAASAVGMAAQSAAGTPTSNDGMQPQAREACTARAAQYGAVHVIDIQHSRVDKIIVWGTVETAGGRQSFECDFKTSITAFKLRPIRTGG